MARAPPETLLAEAAAPVLARVRSDAERVEFTGRALFDYLESYALTVAFSVANLHTSLGDIVLVDRKSEAS